MTDHIAQLELHNGVTMPALGPDEIAAIDALYTGVCGGPDPATNDTNTIPLTIDN